MTTVPAAITAAANTSMSGTKTLRRIPPQNIRCLTLRFNTHAGPYTHRIASWKNLTGSERVDEVKAAYGGVRSSMKELEVGGEEILKAMSELNDVSSRVGQSSRNIRGQSSVVGESVERVQRVSGEVTNGVQEIAIGLEQITSTMEHLVDLSRNIRQIGEQLDSSVAVFTIEDRSFETADTHR